MKNTNLNYVQLIIDNSFKQLKPRQTSSCLGHQAISTSEFFVPARVRSCDAHPSWPVTTFMQNTDLLSSRNLESCCVVFRFYKIIHLLAYTFQYKHGRLMKKSPVCGFEKNICFGSYRCFDDNISYFFLSTFYVGPLVLTILLQMKKNV